MKKLVFIHIATLSLSTGFAQKVGIGTTTPAFKLDVKTGSINTDSLYRINALPVLSIKGTRNIFVGPYTGPVSTGMGNTFLGQYSGYSNTSGYANTFSGHFAGYNNTGGFNNSFFGNYSGYSTTGTGTYQTAMGAYADVAPNTDHATAIGANTYANCNLCVVFGGNPQTFGVPVKAGINNSTPKTDLDIIQQSDAVGNHSRGIQLNRSIPFLDQWRIYVDGSDLLTFEFNNTGAGHWGWINTSGSFVNGSDVRSKKNIQPTEEVLNKVLLLQPKKYLFNTQSDYENYSYGFLAQEVQKIFPEFVSEKEGGYLGIAYSNFGVIAIKAIQEQQQEIDELKKQIELQQKQYEKLKKEIELLDH